MSKNVAEIVTEQIIKGLERGQIAWKKPWASVRPHNFITGHEYQGVNVLLAALACEEFSYKYPLFASFKQLQSKGWKLVIGDVEINTMNLDDSSAYPDYAKIDTEENKPKIKHYS